MSHHQVKTLENEGKLWNVWGNLSWFIWPRNEDKWRCNRAKEEGKIEQMSWVLHYLISCQISARPSLTFSLANSFFLEARTRKRERGREGGWSISSGMSQDVAQRCFVMFYLTFPERSLKTTWVVENMFWFTRWNSDFFFEIQKIFLTSNSDFANLALTSKVQADGSF